MSIQNINGTQLKKMLEEDRAGLEIIDVREQYEYDEIRIKDSKLIPLSEIGARIDEINWSKKVVLVCHSGARSGYVAQALAANGKSTINLEGGIYMLDMEQCDCLEKN
jgi:adenylyltransferase/sulfurtransferase